MTTGKPANVPQVNAGVRKSLPFTRRSKLERLKVERARRTAQRFSQSGHPDSEPEYKPLEWPVLRRMLAWMRPHRHLYFLGAGLGLIMTILEMLSPKYMQHLVDNDLSSAAKYGPHFAGRAMAAVAGNINPHWKQVLWSHFTGPHEAYWNIGFTMVLWAVTLATSITIQRKVIGLANTAGQTVLISLRRAVFDHLQELSMSFYDKTKFGRILTRGTTDIDAITNPMVWGVNTLLNNFIMMSIALFMLFITDWRMALAVLWLGPVLYYMNVVYKGKVGTGWRIVREGFTRVSTNLAENISGMRVVAAYNRQNENLANFNELQTYNTENNMDVVRINGAYQPLLAVVGFLGKVIILTFGCYLIFSTADLPIKNRFTLGTLFATYFYWEWFMGPMLNFGNFYNEIMLAMASAERIVSLLDQKPEVMDGPRAMALPPIKGTVKFEHIVYGYDPAKPVLHDISFEARAGQTVALVGHTGCGKSTIISLICRFYEPQAGTVWIDGYDIKTITGESLHRQMGIVSQSNFLFTGTVMDNIKYARPEVTDEEVFAAAKSLGSHDMIMQLKDGYLSSVGERGSSMSLGQRQLICFTRAFVADPKILMLDEATSAVDTHTEMIIQEALERLVLSRTTFIVAHRLSTVMHADLVLVLEQGRIIERGTHGSLLAENGKYAELFKQFTREI